MKHTLLIVWTMVLVAAVSGYGLFTVWRSMQRWQGPPEQEKVDFQQIAKDKNFGPRDFALLDKDGNLFYSDQLKGKVWILSFFFTTCTKNCLLTNQKLEQLLKKFPTDDLMILSVSCNPELDDPSVLKIYAKQFHADERRWLFLTGDFNEIETRLAKPLLLTYLRGDHRDLIAVVGRDGKLRDTVSTTEPEQFAKLEKDLRTWLDEPVPEDAPAKTKEQPEKKPE